MPKDYKHARRAQRKASATPGWVWLLAGLIPGLMIAALMYLGGFTSSHNSTGQPEMAAPPQTDSTPDTDTRAVRKTPEPKALPEPAVKPRFDFYTILPEMEVAVPEQEVSGKPQQGVAQVEKPGTYVLQAGSFRSFVEADRLKASLVLLGIEATIQTVTVNNKDTWHRVHIGPYKDLAELNQIRTRLKQNHIDAVLLKIKT